jgi:heme o synthase
VPISEAAAAPPAITSEVPAAPRRTLLGVYLELGKARLSALVVVTTGVAFLLAAGAHPDWPRLGWTVFGTALAALGANALNEWLEAARDARMLRTNGRPLPTGRLRAGSALLFGLMCGGVGPVLLAIFVNGGAAILAGSAVFVYVLLYTPLKTRTPACTLIGAVVGALPPLVGWVGASGALAAGGWLLAGILFVWQIPHSLALGWMYRDDYLRGGFRLLPVVDPPGHYTGFLAVQYNLVLVPLSLALGVAAGAGTVYAGAALILGAGMLVLAALFARRRTATTARCLFLASVIYLPLLLGFALFARP